MKKVMVKGLSIFIAMMWLSIGLADNLTHPAYNRIILQITQQQQVATETANLIIRLDANLEEAELPEARSKILTDLNQVVEGDWLITQFTYSQDSSGLIRLFGQAEIRVPEHLLANVYSKTKAISQPGMSYQVQAIDISVPLMELEQAQAELRQRIYNRINDELSRLQEAFPDQDYQVSLVNFDVNMNQAEATKDALYTQGAVVSRAAVNVSDTVRLTATVVLTADRANNDN